MAHPGGPAAHQPQLSAAQRARLNAQVDEVLTNAALSDDEAADLIDSVVDAVVPQRAQAASSSVDTSDEEESPGPAWAADQSPSAPKAESALSGGGGTMPLPVAPRKPSSEDDDDERYPLWRPPTRPTVDVPADVADIAPVAAPAAPDETPTPPPAADPQSAPPRPGPSASPPSRLSAVTRRWSALPSWAKVAVAVAAVLVLVVGQQISSHSAHRREADRAIDGPAPSAVTPPLQAGTPTEQPLQPGCPPNAGAQCRPVDSSCGAGSSDPSLAFGTDPSQAWICARSHNIDMQQIIIQFPKPVVVTSIYVIPGFAHTEKNGQDHWVEHRLVTAILWRIGGEQIEQAISPTPQGSTQKVPGIATQIITGTIQSSQRPPATGKGPGHLPGILGAPDNSKVDETIAISKITINGYPAGQT